MHIAFKRLFGIRVRHGWYADGVTSDDFDIVPAPDTAMLLDELGLRVRHHADGITVFAEVVPDSLPPALRRRLSPTSFRFAFELRARNTALLSITELPTYRPAQQIFCFDNLREEVVSARPLLGDRVAGARIGAPVALVAGVPFVHRLGGPTQSSTVTVRDRFAGAQATLDFHSPTPGVPLTEVEVNLPSIATVVPGRYAISDDQGGVSQIYYDPGLAASRPVGVIEIYTRTEALTPDATNRVPAAYRFVTPIDVNHDQVAGVPPYYLQFEAIATTWRYRITKQYLTNQVPLDRLKITGPVTFTGAVTGNQAVFTSNATMRLSAVARAVRLLKLAQTPGDPDDPVRDLPNPDLNTALGAVPALANYVSDMFVSV